MNPTRIISALLVALSLVLAASAAGTTMPYAVGPPLFLLALGVLVSSLEFRAVPRSGRLVAMAVLVAVGYLGVRASRSEIGDFGISDLLLVNAAALVYWWTWSASRIQTRWIGVALVVAAAANVTVGCLQAIGWLEVSPLLGVPVVSKQAYGLFSHYNYFANFVLGCACLALGFALDRRCGWGSRSVAAVTCLLCVAGILMSGSRGAMLASLVAGVVFLIGWLLALKARRSSMFGIAALSLVVVLPLAGFVGWKLTQRVIEKRGLPEGGLIVMLNGSTRSEFISMAVEQAKEAPLIGGGSRSFSYKCYDHWDNSRMWWGEHEPEWVHNEAMQALVDYGWLGLGALAIVVLLHLVRGFVTVGVPPSSDRKEGPGLLEVGALAGLCGMLAQSMFSFVFHMLPNVLLLAVLLAILARPGWPLQSVRNPEPARLPGKLGVLAAGLLASCFMLFLSWPYAGAAWQLIGPGGGDPSPVDRLDRAARICPRHEVFKSLGEMHLALANRDEENQSEHLSLGAIAFEKSIARNPYIESNRVNLARVYDRMGDFETAQKIYQNLTERATVRERWIRGQFYHGRHWYTRGYREWVNRNPAEALTMMKRAKDLMDKSRQIMFFPVESKYRAVYSDVTRMLGLLNAFVVYQDGFELWHQREPESALAKLLEARRMLQVHDKKWGHAEDSDESRLLKTVDDLIKFLEGAGIKPAESEE